MQIHKAVGETQQEFQARAFRWNRLVGEAFARRQARYGCNCNQGRLPCSCRLTLGEAFPNTKAQRITPNAFETQATPVSIKSLIDDGYLMPYQPVSRISRVRACWYGAGLMFGAALIAMAVFGMGQ